MNVEIEKKVKWMASRTTHPKVLALGLALATVMAAPAHAQKRPGPTTLSTHPLKGGAYWVEGGVSNTGFVVGDKGVVVIDTQINAEDAQKQLAAIAKVTPKPVNTIVLSHADPDHVGGLPAYPAGTPIISQENTRSEMQMAAADPNGGPLFGPLYHELAAHFLPTRTIGSTESVVLDGVRMELLYVAPAHTSGDLVMYLPEQKVVFGGDILLTNNGRFPVIHLGGSSLGWITTVKALLALDAETYVPGHGPLETKAQLRARLTDVEQRREQIKAMVSANKSLAEVEQALPEPGANPVFLTFARTVYDELTKGYPPASPPWANIVHK